MYVISHRGNNNHKYRENTLEAIKEVLNCNYIDGVEFDIRMTNDNKFVLSHSPIYKDDLIKNKKQKEINLDELNYVLKNIETNKIILIDIKYELFDYKKVSLYLNKLLKKYKRLNIYICSFNYDLVLYMKEKYNYISGLLVSNVINRGKNYNLFDFISINYKVDKEIDNILMYWTINKKDIMKKYLNKDVYIITDKPYLKEELKKNY